MSIATIFPPQNGVNILVEEIIRIPPKALYGTFVENFKLSLEEALIKEQALTHAHITSLDLAKASNCKKMFLWIETVAEIYMHLKFEVEGKDDLVFNVCISHVGNTLKARHLVDPTELSCKDIVTMGTDFSSEAFPKPLLQ